MSSWELRPLVAALRSAYAPLRRTGSGIAPDVIFYFLKAVPESAKADRRAALHPKGTENIIFKLNISSALPLRGD